VKIIDGLTPAVATLCFLACGEIDSLGTTSDKVGANGGQAGALPTMDATPQDEGGGAGGGALVDATEQDGGGALVDATEQDGGGALVDATPQDGGGAPVDATVAQDAGPGVSGLRCVVEGQSYDHGAAVPDPFSCNTCRCDYGTLVDCTNIGCPTACPTGTVPGARCMECGNAGGCVAVETACLPPCSTSEDCDDPNTGPYGWCSDGVCSLFPCF
jgi:hypothetical protein